MLDSFWPGSENVDMIGVSLFKSPFNEYGAESMNSVNEVFDFAKSKSKKVMIAESASFGGTDITWFNRILEIMESQPVEIWCYISTNWDVQPQWKGIGFGDTRVPQSWWRKVSAQSTSRKATSWEYESIIERRP